jgi:hypothetical protein
MDNSFSNLPHDLYNLGASLPSAIYNALPEGLLSESDSQDPNNPLTSSTDLSLDATMHLQIDHGRMSIHVDGSFHGHYETALQPA